MSIFKKPNFNPTATKKRPMPDGVFEKCPDCGTMIPSVELTENQRVCPQCEHHFALGARDRLDQLLDPESFQETDAELTSVDVLKFQGVAAYGERLATYRNRTGLRDAVLSGHGLIERRPVAVAVMDFSFLGGSMGSVAGEKITRTVEAATEAGQPVLIFSASGGARLYEGMFALMQMAKTSGALALHAQAGLPFLSVLTNPTTGGVTASFATLGDIILAEPKAMIGFAGPRVIKETTLQDLPAGFQTAEFLKDHGLIDMIVPRKRLRATVSNLLRYLGG